MENKKLPFLGISIITLLKRVYGGVCKKVYLFRGEFKTCAVQIVDDCKLRVNFEVIVLQIGFDVSQNAEVIIIKQENGSILCKILVYKTKNGDNILPFHLGIFETRSNT